MLINLKSETDLSGFYLVYNGSTYLEERGVYGISHLMEHLMCKNFEKLREVFEREAISWNAYTSKNEIVFYFTGLDEMLSKRRYELVELMSEFNVSKEQFEMERQIVLQEYGDYFSDQTESHALNLSRKLFKDYDAIGLREDLESMKYMDCLNFFEKQFQKPSKIINVSKNSAFKHTEPFSELKIDTKISFGPFDDAILEPREKFGRKTSLVMVSELIEEDFNWVNFINAMLSMGLDSPLYQECREKNGLVYYIRCGQSRYNTQGVTTISTQTTNENAKKVIDNVKKVLENPSKFMTKKRFELIKNHHILRLKKDKIMRYDNVSRWINPEGWSIKDIVKILSYDKVMEVYEKYFNFDDFYISLDNEEFK